MAVTVVVGGQYGSEGKGKVAHFLAREKKVFAAVRVGGSNSGHTAPNEAGTPVVLRQLPTAALLPDVLCVLPAGSYIDTALLLREVAQVQLDPERLLIDPNAVIISEADRLAEKRSDLQMRIGSTASGTGAAVMKRLARRSKEDLAGWCPDLARYLGDTRSVLRDTIDADRGVVIEGTQGFGLSALHSRQFPNVTTRDTTAAGALSEAGLSPLDVSDVVLVIRTFPIRVAGNSGDFGAEEIDWTTVTRESGRTDPIIERTSVTQKVRRVARFDPSLVRDAIKANRPSTIVLNHLDYVDASAGPEGLTPRAWEFVRATEQKLGSRIDLLGVGPHSVVARQTAEIAA